MSGWARTYLVRCHASDLLFLQGCASSPLRRQGLTPGSGSQDWTRFAGSIQPPSTLYSQHGPVEGCAAHRSNEPVPLACSGEHGRRFPVRAFSRPVRSTTTLRNVSAGRTCPVVLGARHSCRVCADLPSLSGDTPDVPHHSYCSLPVMLRSGRLCAPSTPACSLSHLAPNRLGRA